MSETEPEVTKVETALDKAAEEVEKVEEKLEDPKTTDAERAKLEARLDSLDERMDKLIGKLDAMAASPVAPAPRKAVEAEGAVEKVAAAEVTPETPKERKHRYGSRIWWGDRAYDTD